MRLDAGVADKRVRDPCAASGCEKRARKVYRGTPTAIYCSAHMLATRHAAHVILAMEAARSEVRRARSKGRSAVNVWGMVAQDVLAILWEHGPLRHSDIKQRVFWFRVQASADAYVSALILAGLCQIQQGLVRMCRGVRPSPPSCEDPFPLVRFVVSQSRGKIPDQHRRIS